MLVVGLPYSIAVIVIFVDRCNHVKKIINCFNYLAFKIDVVAF